MHTDINDINSWLPAIIITSVIIAAGFILQKIILVYFHRLARKERWRGGLVLVSSLRRMIALASVVIGIYEGLVYSPLKIPEMQNIRKFYYSVIILIATVVIGRVLKGMLKTYTGREEGMKGSLSLFNTVISIVVFCIGGLIILDTLGISITPVITALGIGGLAVALALQDTLSNLFAGIHITIAHILKPGDYIVMSTGEEGTVTDINWRCTTLLNQSDNIVVIPNSKLATTSVTNFSLPEKSLDITIPITISYSTDIDKAEKIILEITESVMKEMGAQEANLSFRAKEFGETGVKCGINLTVHDFNEQYLIRHKIVKRLLTRFKQEGIEIPFPTRNLLMKNDKNL